jgi:hypothetical protein
MRETPVKVTYISKKKILVVKMHSFTLLISCCYSVIILSVDFAGGVFFWRCSIQQLQRFMLGYFAGFLGMRPPSDFSATSASDFYHRGMLSMLQKLGPALDQVKAWQQAVDPAIDELRQVGYLLPQLMAQIRDSAGQINEFSQQQQRFEVALLGGLSEEQVAATGAGLGGSTSEVLGGGRLSAE